MLKSKIRFPGKWRKSEELAVTANEAGLHQVRDFVLRMVGEVNLRRQEAHNLRLVVDEAASNIFRHAYKLQPGKIEVKISVYSRYLRIELIDQGESFAWKKAKTPDLNQYVADRKKGGLGIWFIRKL